jgi:hypothetical protein
MKHYCWCCERGIETDDLVFKCVCGTENDFRPYQPTNIEENNTMPFEKSDNAASGAYIKLPKEGESYDYTKHGKIVEITKVENQDHEKGKYNFIKKVSESLPSGKVVKVDEDQGYFYLILFEDGSKMTISSWSPFFAMQKANIMEGMSMMVEHPAKGEWIIRRA